MWCIRGSVLDFKILKFRPTSCFVRLFDALTAVFSLAFRLQMLHFAFKTCISFTNRAFEIANSDYLGMELCCGCWLEGGEEHFGNIYDSIRQFVKMGKVSIVHFRNVSSSLPRFTETFIDDGYANMYKIMKCFVESGYNGTMIYDHVPATVPEAGEMASAAYAVGYMKGVLQAAETELRLR